MKILVTGAAGFIGTNLVNRLMKDNHFVTSVDIHPIEDSIANHHCLADVSKDKHALKSIFKFCDYDIVIHLAALAGVRQSLDNRDLYVRNNVMGMTHILDLCKEFKVRLIYASSSSVYGMTDGKPSKETDSTNPISVYAATKKMCEVLAETYSNLYRMDIVGLRFFTVYGPYGRQDMAIHKFTDAIYKGETIELNSPLATSRSFTYVDDITYTIEQLIHQPKVFYHTVFNVGSEQSITLDKLISTIENCLGKKAKWNQPQLKRPLGDVDSTKADCTRLHNYIQYKPNTQIEEGISKFVEWYLANKGGTDVGG